MAESCCNLSVKILDKCLVCPPSGSVPTTHLPLSFFDIIWLRHAPKCRLFFYKFPHSTAHFTDTILPSLKQSLSLTLQHFYPFCGKLIVPPQPQKPHLLYTPQDSVHLVIAESDSPHFHALLPDHPKDAKDVYQLFPDWPEFGFLSDGTQLIPLLTLQITIFPYQGLSIAVSFLHVAVDGPALHHFIKSWASIFAGKELDAPPPFHDRTVVQDPHGLESAFLRLHWSIPGPINFYTEPISQRLGDKVRATLSLSKHQIERLKNWGKSQITKLGQPLEMESPYFSSFVVTCSLVWVCFVVSHAGRESELVWEDELCCFSFVANCRNGRLGYPIPRGYFGNCLAYCVAAIKKSEVLGGNGMVVGMKAIGKRVEEVEKEAVGNMVEEISVWMKSAESGIAVAVVGSPILGAYDTNFGWGRPIKTEVLQIDSGRLFCLGESRDEKGGIEVGLALSSPHMARFVAVWEQNLKLFGCL